jgi:fused signal recognition particle receptor
MSEEELESSVDEQEDLGRWADLFGLERPAEPEDPEPKKRRGFLSRMRESLAKPRQGLAPQLASMFSDRPVGPNDWDDLEEALISADCGLDTTDEIVNFLRAEAGAGRIVMGPDLAKALWKTVAERMSPEPPRVTLGGAPTVIMVAGVNGSGKTTTVGKIAYRLSQLDQKVVIGAADTFRAAAIEQLETWAERGNAELVRQAPGADPGAVAFDAVAAGKARGADVVLVDTAGRLQTEHNLMDELKKVAGVMSKVDPAAPHETLLVLDATTGQNGISQARLFGEAVPLTGVVLTKLDGVARGGIALAIHSQLGVPVVLAGTGEGVDDLQPFDARAYAQAIFSPDDP